MASESMLDNKDIDSIFLKRQFRITGDENNENKSTPNDSKSTTPSLSKKTAQSGGLNGNRTLLSVNMQNRELKNGKKYDLDIPQNTTNLDLIMRKRMEGIDLQMKDFIHIMREFTEKSDIQM